MWMNIAYPSQIGRLTALESLVIQLDGSALAAGMTFAPAIQLSAFHNARSIKLRDVRRGVEWGTDLSRLTNLETLDLQRTGIADIPSTIGHLRSLQYLDLDECDISGTIPEGLWNLTSLARLELQSNNITGTLSPNLGKLVRLTELQVNDNLLFGSLPSQIGLLARLTLLELQANRFDGKIPSHLSLLYQLRQLNIAENSFYGEFRLTPTTSLVECKLNTNRANSEQKNCFSTCNASPLCCRDDKCLESEQLLSSVQHTALMNLYNSVNCPERYCPRFKLIEPCRSIARSVGYTLKCVGRAVTEINLDGRSVALFGQLPSSLLPLSYLTVLSIQHANITGSLPLVPSNIKQLVLANLSLHGAVDPLFSSVMSDLWSLDVSRNKLNGSVPDLFWKAPSLRYLNLSHNGLTGSLLLQSFVSIPYLQTIDTTYNRFSGAASALSAPVCELRGGPNDTSCFADCTKHCCAMGICTGTNAPTPAPSGKTPTPSIIINCDQYFAGWNDETNHCESWVATHVQVDCVGSCSNVNVTVGCRNVAKQAYQNPPCTRACRASSCEAGFKIPPAEKVCKEKDTECGALAYCNDSGDCILSAWEVSGAAIGSLISCAIVAFCVVRYIVFRRLDIPPHYILAFKLQEEFSNNGGAQKIEATDIILVSTVSVLNDAAQEQIGSASIVLLKALFSSFNNRKYDPKDDLDKWAKWYETLRKARMGAEDQIANDKKCSQFVNTCDDNEKYYKKLQMEAIWRHWSLVGVRKQLCKDAVEDVYNLAYNTNIIAYINKLKKRR
jgi:Leucine-rich repeat (LRR) protein